MVIKEANEVEQIVLYQIVLHEVTFEVFGNKFSWQAN